MADVMGGASAGGDGGDDGRRPNKDNENSWYKCHMVDAFGNITTEKWQVRDWMEIGYDGRRILVPLDAGRVPCGREGKYLRQVLGKIIAMDNLPIGPEDWRNVSDLDNASIWDSYVMPRFTWVPKDEHDMKRYVLQDVGKKWREHRGRVWSGVFGEGQHDQDYLIEHKPNENYDDKDWERFMKYRMGTKGQKRSATNKANIAVQKIYHTHGSKPFNITQEEKVHITLSLVIV
ncbi:hypothetical protein LINPERHAP2_LOCUS7520 [Linum perenne]